MKTTCIAALPLAAAIAAGVASSASADVTYTLTNQTFSGFNFTQAAAAGSLAGTLTGVSVDAVLLGSISYTYADDLCVYLDAGALSTGGALQVGGFSTLLAAQRYVWPNGDYIGDVCDFARGDLNLDGIVNASDGPPFFNAWGSSAGSPADMNFDGVVNASDFSILLGNWGTTG